MGLNIKNREVERLAAEVAEMQGETKTEAIRRALEERRTRLAAERAGGSRGERLRRFLEQELWPQVPDEERGRTLSRSEEEAILGYGPEGV
jgi:antitoxin VapB